MADRHRIEKVAIVGAGGNSGKFMAEALLNTGKHIVTAITRVNSTSKLPTGLLVRHIDYDDPSTITEALKGQDALIITMSTFAPKEYQTKLIHAAAEAEVPWILPNEWGLDAANEALNKDTLVAEDKKKARELISSLGKSSWIAVSTGFWYEWSLALPFAYGFEFANRSVTLYDEGDTAICISTWPRVGLGVARLLSLPITSDQNNASKCLEAFRNGFVYISSFTISQNDMFESVLRVTKTQREEWNVKKEPVKERYERGLAEMRAGTGGWEPMGTVLYSRPFFPDDTGNFEKTRGTQNELLGLLEDEDIDHFTQIAIDRASKWNN